MSLTYWVRWASSLVANKLTDERDIVGAGRRPLRVLMLAAADYDIDARIRRQAEALVSRGDLVTALVLGGDTRKESVCVIDGVSVVQLPVSKYRGDSARNYLAVYVRFWMLAFLRLVRHPRSFDLIQVHSMPEVLVFCAIVPRLLGTPVLLDVHDLTSELFAAKFRTGWWMRLVRLSEWCSMRFATATMTVHAEYAQLIRRLHGSAPRDLHVVVNAPDESRFSDFRLRSWDHRVTFSFHGTLVHRYGVINMIEAFGKVHEHLPGARLQILGDGDARQDIVAAVSRLGLSDVVTISPGRVSIDDMPRMLEEVDIGLAPNLLDRFTAGILPTKVLEYAALGVPVIASRLPVLTDYFDDDAVKYVSPGDLEALVSAMFETVRDPEAARIRATRAHAALQTISWHKQRAVYLAVIDGMVEL